MLISLSRINAFAADLGGAWPITLMPVAEPSVQQLSIVLCATRYQPGPRSAAESQYLASDRTRQADARNLPVTGGDTTYSPTKPDLVLRRGRRNGYIE
jgi:hypothetical protein